MRNILFFMLTVSLLGSLYGCNTIEVSSEYDQQKDFAQIKTFDWISRLQDEPESQDKENPFIKERIKRAIEDNLASKGIKRQESGDVDVYVEFYGKKSKNSYVSTSMPVIGSTTSYSPGGFGSGYSGHHGYNYPRNYHNNRRYYGPVYSSTVVYGSPEKVLNFVDVGALVIDMVDPSSNELIWRSIAQAEINNWNQVKRNDKAVSAVGCGISACQQFGLANAELRNRYCCTGRS